MIRLFPLLGALLLVPGVVQAVATLEDCDRASHEVRLQAADPPPATASQAVWLSRSRLRWPQAQGDGFLLVQSRSGQLRLLAGQAVEGADRTLTLSVVPASSDERFRYLRGGVELALRPADVPRRPDFWAGQWMLVQVDGQGRLLRATGTQIAAALDDSAAGAEAAVLGATVRQGQTRFALWAPTARQVSLCLYPGAQGAASALWPLRPDPRSGVWQLQRRGDLSGRAYTYLVEVFVPGAGWVRNRVTDPYAASLNTDSLRTAIVDLDSPQLAPPGWRNSPRPAAPQSNTDLVIYELHVRDFSIGDASVPPAHRGKYLAFTDTESQGMQHLRRLAQAGLTDVHLLPVFDFATVPEAGCMTPELSGAPDGESQQATAMAHRAEDCFNWGYDPLHYGAPEGSYASDAADGTRRVIELRQAVQALHRLGLRVGMDVVYNHTSASGQHRQSVLDRIVPGYYQRLDEQGAVATSTCCANTATEHRMMAKLMIDTAERWVRHYGIDSFRFDLMGHQPREVMQRLQARVDAVAGRRVPLIGEGWNFGEVADGARFVQASQLSLGGSGIGTFSDRGRDAVRGGGPSDNGDALMGRQGWINGLVYDRNALAPASDDAQALMRTADLVRVALAGSLRKVELQTYTGRTLTLQEIDYNGQPAGYASEPGEVVNYVDNHDNQTLFDINAMKLPPGTSREDRARVQVLGLAVTALSQGVAYFHAGSEILRSKSLDRNSYDSGDGFNLLDWSLQDNHFGEGLPPEPDNGVNWPWMRPLLANPLIKPAPSEIRWTRDAFADLLRIRASTGLLRLRSTEDVRSRLRFLNTGSDQVPTVAIVHLQGSGLAGAVFREVLVCINVDLRSHTLALDALAGKPLVLHPVHRAADAADRRPVEQARWDAATGRITVPARTAVVYVLE